MLTQSPYTPTQPERYIQQPLNAEIKRMIKTLDKYIAIDMALALGTYDTVVLD